MKTKYEISKEILNNSDIIICPKCKNRLILFNHDIKCKNNHNYNISKKGTINLLSTSHYKDSKMYNQELFKNRRLFISKMFYTDIYNCILELFPKKNNINILDIGCGEFTHTNILLQRYNFSYNLYGFDYSKVAINLASDYLMESSDNKRLFFVSDVNNIPIKDNSIDVVLDFLSPYNEKEVKRVLKKGGIFIKICPGNNYLIELRKVLSIPDYDKNIIKDNLLKQYKKISFKEISNTYRINEKEAEYLFKMTPTYKKTEKYDMKTIDNITIDMIVYHFIKE